MQCCWDRERTEIPSVRWCETAPSPRISFSYAAKPDENCEDPADVLAIQQAVDNMGDFKLKTDKDYSVPEHLRMSADRKRAQLVALEEQVATDSPHLF